MPAHAFPKFGNRGPCSNLANLCQEKVRKRHSGERGLSFERTMQVVGNIADFDRSRHMPRIDAYAMQVEATLAALGRENAEIGYTSGR